MGILDFFRKGKEERVEKRQSPATPTSTPTSRPTQAPPSGNTSPSGPSMREYTIQPGDSLSKIAKKVYGNAGDWQKIHQANKDKIKNPDMIFPGQKIVIP